MRRNGENEILRGIFHVLSRFPLHFMLYCENFDYFSNSVAKLEFSKNAYEFSVVVVY